MTEDERIVQEWPARHWVSPDQQTNLAQRIDAALAEAKQAGTAIIHDEARALFAERELAEQAARVERLEVQLAGCSTAAMGWTADPATPEQYGWSRAYQDVLELRKK